MAVQVPLMGDVGAAGRGRRAGLRERHREFKPRGAAPGPHDLAAG